MHTTLKFDATPAVADCVNISCGFLFLLLLLLLLSSM